MPEITPKTPEVAMNNGPAARVAEKSYKFIDRQWHSPEAWKNRWEPVLEKFNENKLSKATPEEQGKIRQRIEDQAKVLGTATTVAEGVATAALIGVGISKHREIGKAVGALAETIAVKGKAVGTEIGKAAQTAQSEATRLGTTVRDHLQNTPSPRDILENMTKKGGGPLANQEASRVTKG